jgi:hypothetical protein
MVYDSTLSSVELASVNQYLTQRWLDIPEPSTVVLTVLTLALGLARRLRNTGR